MVIGFFFHQLSVSFSPFKNSRLRKKITETWFNGSDFSYLPDTHRSDRPLKSEASREAIAEWYITS